tara:strand:- start:27 stop:251 length:225 start_codon:yes stop_codon:yes gene_type:complete
MIHTSFIPTGTQVSRLGTERSSLEILIATLLTCASARDILSGITNENAGPHYAEIIEVVKEGTEPGCNWDAKVD